MSCKMKIEQLKEAVAGGNAEVKGGESFCCCFFIILSGLVFYFSLSKTPFVCKV